MLAFWIFFACTCMGLAQLPYDNEWFVGSTTLPRSFHRSQAGIWNGTASILGSHQYPYQLIQFDLKTEQFTDFGTSFFSVALDSVGHTNTELDNFMYALEASGNYLTKFNLATNEFEHGWKQLPATRTHAGLVTHANSLYVVGGTIVDTLYILDMTTEVWTQGPSMNYAKMSPGCIVVNDWLWAIGGYPNDAAVEKINMNNILQNIWQESNSLLIGDHHSVPIASTVSTDILVIGGHNPDSRAFDRVQVIDTLTGSVRSAAGHMAYASTMSNVFLVGTEVYSIGGWDEVALNTWQYTYLDTLAPTSNPTKDPTIDSTCSVFDVDGFLVDCSCSRSQSALALGDSIQLDEDEDGYIKIDMGSIKLFGVLLFILLVFMPVLMVWVSMRCFGPAGMHQYAKVGVVSETEAE